MTYTQVKFDERDRLTNKIVFYNYLFAAVLCIFFEVAETIKILNFVEQTTRPLVFMIVMSLFCVYLFSIKKAEHFKVLGRYSTLIKGQGIIKMSAFLIGFSFVLLIVPYLIIFFPGDVGRVAYAHKAMTESLFSLWLFGPIMSVCFYISLVIIFVQLPVVIFPDRQTPHK